ncbi:MAG: HDOD domain-containing protein [bacterium]
MDEATRAKIAASIKDLPTLPSITTQIFAITSDPDATVEELKSIISTDQVVAGRIMRAVNSAYYGFPRQIDNLTKAIVILGFNNVRSITLSVSMMEIFKPTATGFNHSELWAHAVGTAHCARTLARANFPRSNDQFFLAGLLHDIGFVALNRCFPDEFMACVSSAINQKRPFFEVEDEMFEFNHADVGQFIADKWLLPAGLVKAIGCHHRPQDAVDDLEITYAVHVADILCKLASFGSYGDNEPFNLSSIYEPAKRMYEIGEDGPKSELKNEIIEDLEEAASFVNILK